MSELPLLTSPLLPARHGFTTRAGGVSAPPYDSLNLGFKWGDSRAAVEENRARLLRASGASRMAFVSQVHGARVVVAHDRSENEEADGIITDRPGLALGVFSADCVPALFVDTRTGAVGAAHAGWRGTVAGVLPATVAAMTEAFGSRPADLRVALGPAIGPCCFEVGPEVAAVFPPAVIHPGPHKPHVDLRAHQRQQLLDVGVQHVDAFTACTRCEPQRFFSYRRDNTRGGIHIAFVVRAP